MPYMCNQVFSVIIHCIHSENKSYSVTVPAIIHHSLIWFMRPFIEEIHYARSDFICKQKRFNWKPLPFTAM